TGITVNNVSLDDDQRDGFGGLFVFESVSDFMLGRPDLWRQAFGQSQTAFSTTSFGGFAQDNWRALPNLVLNLGGRYDIERLPNPFATNKDNVSARLGAAWNPSDRWIVRAGFGTFFDRFPLAFLNNAIQKNGAGAFEQVAFGNQAATIFASSGGG